MTSGSSPSASPRPSNGSSSRIRPSTSGSIAAGSTSPRPGLVVASGEWRVASERGDRPLPGGCYGQSSQATRLGKNRLARHSPLPSKHPFHRHDADRDVLEREDRDLF